MDQGLGGYVDKEIMDTDTTPEAEKAQAFQAALAAYYDCAPEDIRCFVMAVERNNEEGGITLSSAWTGGLASWSAEGMVRELLLHIGTLRP